MNKKSTTSEITISEISSSTLCDATVSGVVSRIWPLHEIDRSQKDELFGASSELFRILIEDVAPGTLKRKRCSIEVFFYDRWARRASRLRQKDIIHLNGDGIFVIPNPTKYCEEDHTHRLVVAPSNRNTNSHRTIVMRILHRVHECVDYAFRTTTPEYGPEILLTSDNLHQFDPWCDQKRNDEKIYSPLSSDVKALAGPIDYCTSYRKGGRLALEAARRRTQSRSMPTERLPGSKTSEDAHLMIPDDVADVTQVGRDKSKGGQKNKTLKQWLQSSLFGMPCKTSKFDNNIQDVPNDRDSGSAPTKDNVTSVGSTPSASYSLETKVTIASASNASTQIDSSHRTKRGQDITPETTVHRSPTCEVSDSSQDTAHSADVNDSFHSSASDAYVSSSITDNYTQALLLDLACETVNDATDAKDTLTQPKTSPCSKRQLFVEDSNTHERQVTDCPLTDVTSVSSPPTSAAASTLSVTESKTFSGVKQQLSTTSTLTRSLSSAYPPAKPVNMSSCRQLSHLVVNEVVDIIAVVIGCTLPSATRGTDLSSQALIIDDSITSVLEPVQMLYFAPKAAEHPNCTKVGDILYVRRICPKKYNNNNQLLSRRETSSAILRSGEIIYTTRNCTVSPEVIARAQVLETWFHQQVAPRNDLLNGRYLMSLEDVVSAPAQSYGDCIVCFCGFQVRPPEIETGAVSNGPHIDLDPALTSNADRAKLNLLLWDGTGAELQHELRSSCPAATPNCRGHIVHLLLYAHADFIRNLTLEEGTWIYLRNVRTDVDQIPYTSDSDKRCLVFTEKSGIMRLSDEFGCVQQKLRDYEQACEQYDRQELHQLASREPLWRCRHPRSHEPVMRIFDLHQTCLNAVRTARTTEKAFTGYSARIQATMVSHAPFDIRRFALQIEDLETGQNRSQSSTDAKSWTFSFCLRVANLSVTNNSFPHNASIESTDWADIHVLGKEACGFLGCEPSNLFENTMSANAVAARIESLYDAGAQLDMFVTAITVDELENMGVPTSNLSYLQEPNQPPYLLLLTETALS